MKQMTMCRPLLLLFAFAPSSFAADRAPQQVADRELDNLVAFTRLLGYVRYFHPSDESAGANWDVVAIEGMQAIEKAENARDLANKLQTFFKPLAPTVQVFASDQRSAEADKMTEPKGATRLLVWRHFSVPMPRKPDTVSSVRI